MQCRIKVYYCNSDCKILIFAEKCKQAAVISYKNRASEIPEPCQ